MWSGGQFNNCPLWKTSKLKTENSFLYPWNLSATPHCAHLGFYLSCCLPSAYLYITLSIHTYLSYSSTYPFNYTYIYPLICPPMPSPMHQYMSPSTHPCIYQAINLPSLYLSLKCSYSWEEARKKNSILGDPK